MAGVYRLLTGVVGFLIPIGSSGNLLDFSRRLTPARCRKYIASVVKRGDSTLGAAIYDTAEMEIPTDIHSKMLDCWNIEFILETWELSI